MMKILRSVASLRLTTATLLLAAAGGFATILQPEVSAAVIVVPLLLVAVNLAAAIGCRASLRRGGLGLFHGCLLACIVLVALGRLTHLDGRVRVIDGQEFDPAAVEIDARGFWHGDPFAGVAFRQGAFSVTYAPGIMREHTTSLVATGTGDRAHWQAVGDDTPLKIDGYRFYTTSNKGFAPVLTWIPEHGEPITGTIVLPSYPANDWLQTDEWQAPGGPAWKFALHLPKVPEDVAWTLDPARTNALLVAESEGIRHELRAGDEVRTPRGTLRYEWLASWMGYRIFYDPTLVPLFALSLLGVAGMACHLWARGLRSLTTAEPAAA